MAELMFVNTSNPKRANPKARRLIRSHISKRQHEKKRLALAQALKLEQARLQVLENRSEDAAVTPQYDSVPSSLSSRGNPAPARTSECAEERTTTPLGFLAADEPGSRRATVPDSRFASRPLFTTARDDPVNELNGFARKLGINVSPLLNHFYKVVSFMATIG